MRSPPFRPLSIAALLIAGAAGCHRRPADNPPPAPQDAGPPDAHARLDGLVQEHVEALLLASPVTATWLGARGYDDRLDDLSPEAQGRELLRLRRALERLQAIPEAGLDPSHQLDRQLLFRDLRIRLFELAEARPLEHSPVRYLDVFSSGIYELLAKETAPLPDRLRSITGRLARSRAFFDEARRNLKNPPELSTRRAIELAQGARAFLADTLPRVVTAVADERLLADFRTAQADALRALDDFVAWLQKELLPRSRGELSFGRDKLLERLRLRHLIEQSPDQFPGRLISVTEKELKAATRRFEEAARAVAPGKSPGEALRLLEEDRPTAEQLIPSVATTVDQLLAFAREHRLVTLPEARPKVQEMPPYLWGFVLHALSGPLDPSPSSLIYVDPVNKSWDRKTREEHLRALSRAQVTLSLAHDVLGHFVQAEAARRAPSLMQKIATGDGLAEGWALYVGQLLVDEEFHTPRDPADGGAEDPATAPGPDARLRLAERREVLLELCRLVAALRLHATGMKLDDAVKIFTDEGYLDDSAARREAERAALDPGVLDAGLSALSLARLHDDARRARGSSYSALAFHDQVLAHGSAPPALLRKLLFPTEGVSWF